MERKVNGRRRSAKRSGKKHHTTRRRRRVGAANDFGGMAQKAGGLVVGAVAARELNTLAVKFFPGLTPMMSGIIQMGVGFMLPKFVKGAFFQNMADGMIANGGMVTVVSTGIITGTDGTLTYRINGTSNLKVVSGGTPNMQVVNGPSTRISNQAPAAPRAQVRNIAVRG